MPSSLLPALNPKISNCFHALDTLYYSTPPKERRRGSFVKYRLTVRVHLDLRNNALHITDLGEGMMRGDLINVLGAPVVPSVDEDYGGFFSALLATSTAVEVATKNKYDDYYVFKISASDYGSFEVRRPHPEGTIPSASTGQDQFWDVVGVSGTRVTIYLSPKVTSSPDFSSSAIESILATCFEASNYSVIFSDTNRPETQPNESKMQEDDDEDDDEADDAGDDDDVGMSDPGALHSSSVYERSKYIPLRLSLNERKMLRLVEASMNCSSYTTMVDSSSFKKQSRRNHKQLQGITGVLNGLVTACNYEAGQKLAEDRNFSEYEEYFRRQFEIARRHKVMNPEKMRSEYGKLVYLLADAVSPEIKPHLGFSVTNPMRTVHRFLEFHGGEELLQDKLIDYATQEILPDAGKSRHTIQQEIKRKERAVAKIKEKYATSNLSEEDIHMCLYSICDNNSFLNSNRLPIDKMIVYVKKYFSPTVIKEGFSLSIVSGEDGARLSHSHERQYYYALQSLTLWRDILDDMFRLWSLAEDDLLSESITYTLKDTGQGMQRVQQSPKTYKAMQQILRRVQQNVDHWIGSSMVHLGDHNVPNALVFIDKYAQVPRILSPIIVCLEQLDKLAGDDEGADDNLTTWIDEVWGGVEKVKMTILHDFLRSAFDGSGASSNYDAGSCIDGRLTSAWNWCQALPEKDFYPIFKLTGFTGFDGEWK